MRKSVIVSLFLAVALPVSAQEKNWTLEECINYAIEHNISVSKGSLTVQQREIDLDNARNSYLPGFAASGSQNFSFGRGLTADNTYSNTNTTATSLSIGGELPIFDGLKKKNTVIYNKLNLAAATEDLEKIKDDIRTSVAGAYVQVLYNTEILGVAQNQIGIDSMQVARLEAMAANGRASEAEVAQQQATLAKSRLTAVQASNNLKMALLDLTQLLELDTPEGFQVTKPDESLFTDSVIPDPEQIYQTALGIKPGILSEELRLDAAQANVAIAKSGYYPSLSLSGGLGTNYYTASGFTSAKFFEQLGNNFSQYVGLSLNIPIFSRFSTRNNVKSARLSFDSQALQLENTMKDLYKEIQQAYYNALSARSKYESSVEAERSAAQAFELMQAKYENGKANVTEFNASKGQLLEAQSNLVQARYEFLYQTRLLQFYGGEEINF